MNGECRCPAGQIACGGVGEASFCVDPTNDESHCGGCGQACGFSAQCDAGQCQCRPEARFDGGCLDIGSDPSNCGRQGLVCPSSLCAEGFCQPRVIFESDSIVYEVQVIGATVFWASPKGEAVRRADTTGGQQGIVASNQMLTVGMAADDQRLCWSTTTKPLTGVQCLLLGANQTTVAHAGSLLETPQLRGDELLFLTDERHVHALSLDGGATRALRPYATGTFAPFFDVLLVTSRAEPTKLWSERAGGGWTLLVDHDEDIVRVAAHGERVYFSDQAQELHRLWPDGGVELVYWPVPTGLFVVGDAGVYWANQRTLYELPHRD